MDTEGASRKSQRLNKKLSKDSARRTIFVGNLPLGVSKKKLEKLFNRAIKTTNTHVESVRFRGAVSASGGTGKMAFKRAMIHNENAGISNSKFAYILLSSIDGVAAALVLNGHWLTVKSDDLTKDARHIRVDSLTSKNKRFRNSVFLGNLPFDCNEEDIRKSMCSFGTVTNVRLVRDRQTGAVKGFGYVQFADPSVISLVLRANESIEIGSRKIRIQECKYEFENKVNKGKANDEASIIQTPKKLGKNKKSVTEKQKELAQKKIDKKLKRKIRRAHEFEMSQNVNRTRPTKIVFS